MDSKTLVGRSLFFLAICVFVALFSALFGSENSLAGVTIVVLALMMLGRDLSVRPWMNMAGLLALNLAMGLGSFVSVYCGNAFLAAAVNFAVVFAFSFLTTRDLRSPMHFPFLLGYAFLLSVPVSPDQLPVRMLSLAAGSVFVVALNVLVNRGRRSGTCHEGVRRLCRTVSGMCDTVLEGGTADAGELDSLCLEVRDSMQSRLGTSFLTSRSDGRLLDLVSALQMAGRSVCSGGNGPEVLADLRGLLDLVASHESGDAECGEVRSHVDRFLSSHGDADPSLSAAVALLGDSLDSLSGGQEPRDVRRTMRGLAREELRTDSARFSFSVRMSVMFTLWAFVWQHWDLENAKWLLFTTVALVLPYVDSAWRKSAMRLTGTLAGVAVFAVAMTVIGGDVGMMTAVLLAANYLYTVLDPRRYDVMMVFITFSALTTASMSSPADDAVLERVCFVLLGVVAAVLSNYLLLPYRSRDENVVLAGRRLELSERMLGCLSSALDGRRDRDLEDVLALSASGVSAKMRANLSADHDPNTDLFLSLQDGVTSEAAYLCGRASGLDDDERRAARAMLSGEGRVSTGEGPYLSVLGGTLASMRESERLLSRLG